VAELAPIAKEVANLQIREANAHRHANKAKESFVALSKKVRLDTVEFERL
jgi:hypothetical protein